MELHFYDVVIRIGLAFLAGLILGLERENHGRAAGLRTTVLVCVAGAAAMVLSDHLYLGSFALMSSSSQWHPDPARLAAGILTGMGFLGGGVIIQQGNLVRGVTTASVLWFGTILGLCFGSGYILLGMLGLAVSVIVLFIMPLAERFIAKDWYATLIVTTILDALPSAQIEQVLDTLRVHIKNIDWNENLANKTSMMRFSLKFKKRNLTGLPEQVVKRVAAFPGVMQVEWK